ncbi:MAG: ABC transporter substrate-binding protein, partial [Synergistaceae bacterium]|nr:ABC transporter substrate-binding protein [Synergistaceae bacterium]
MKKKSLICTALVILTCLSFASAAFAASEVKDEDKYGGVLNMALSAIPANIDPVKYTSVYENQIINVICDSLVRYNDDLSRLVPSLATEWSANEAGDVYNFKLRQDAYFQPGKFQDGRQMKAADVKFSLERSRKQSALNRLAMLDHVEIVNDFEVNCFLETPNASFATALTNGGNVIVPQEEVEGWGDEFGAHLVGTGAFMMKEWVTDERCEVVRHDKYWGPKPYLDGVAFRYISDGNMRANALRSKEVHIANDLRDEAIGVVKNDPELILENIPGMGVNYIYFNMVNGPTSDIKVRRAMTMALDIDQLNKALFRYEDGSRGYMPLPPGSWGYDPSLESLVPKYDPAAAKVLLAEAGYPDGFSTKYYTSDTQSAIKVATIFQQYMKENLNIEIEIQTAQWGTFSATASSGNAPIFAMSWSWYPDPYFYLDQMFHTRAIGALGNGQGFKSDEVDNLLNEAVKLPDQDKRTELYKKALRIIVESNAQIDYAVRNVLTGMTKDVHGFTGKADSTVVLCSPTANVWLGK